LEWAVNLFSTKNSLISAGLLLGGRDDETDCVWDDFSGAFGGGKQAMKKG
jgi:hypothetical protein